MKTKILVVEDDPLLQDLICFVLDESDDFQSCGYADNGADALILADFDSPDLALIDINIIGPMDGIQLARQLRQQFNLPCILMTGYLGTDVIMRAMVSRPIGFLAKPLEIDNLLQQLRHYLNRWRTG